MLGPTKVKTLKSFFHDEILRLESSLEFLINFADSEQESDLIKTQKIELKYCKEKFQELSEL